MGALRNLDIDLLRSFAAIADLRSLTKAAAALGRTQPTISQQLKRLEETVGRPLLHRTARAVRLTPDGEVMLAYARSILRTNDEAVARLTEPDLEGVIRFGTPEDFATTYLPGVLAAFARSHPRVGLEVNCDLSMTLLQGFDAGSFDLVLYKRLPRAADQDVRVWREPLIWVAADPAVLDRPAVPLVVAPQPCVYRRRAIEALERAGHRWQVSYTSPSLAGAQAAVLAGLGVAVLPATMVPTGLPPLGPDAGFPSLDDTEIVLRRAPHLPRAAERLAEHIVLSLERTAPAIRSFAPAGIDINHDLTAIAP